MKTESSALWLITLLLWLQGCGGYNRKLSPTYETKICHKELLEATDLNPKQKIDHIVVEKKSRKMYLYRQGKLIDTIPVSLGGNPIGTKVKRGDMRTPEGKFWIDRKLCSPKYYRSLCISYPRPEDSERARKIGVDPGGNITIHAQPKWNADGHANSYTLSKNWTQGCVAITNQAMDKLWYAVREGVEVTIYEERPCGIIPPSR